MGAAVLSSMLPRAWSAEVHNGIPYHTLGNTGERVSCIGLGGSHIGVQSDERQSIPIVRTAGRE